MNNHSHLVNKTLLWIGENCPHIRAWKNPTGQAYTIASVADYIDSGDVKKLVRISFGMVGQADISGIIQGGKRIEIEIKTGTGKQSAVQKSWQAMIEQRGGLYLVVRDVKDLNILLN